MLIKFVGEKKEVWQDYLDTCVFAYNTSIHESSKYSPFEVMFYRKAVLPVDFISTTKQCSEENLDDCLNKSHSQFTEARKKQLENVKANIVIAQARQKQQYDRKHCNLEAFKVGSIVLKKDFLRRKRAHGKFDPKWVGPYIITKFLGRGLYTLELVEDRTKIISRVNGVHLKTYYQTRTSIDEQLTASSSLEQLNLSNSELFEDCIIDDKGFKMSTPLKDSHSQSSLSPLKSSSLTISNSYISLPPASPNLPPASPNLPPASPIHPLPDSPTPVSSAKLAPSSAGTPKLWSHPSTKIAMGLCSSASDTAVKLHTPAISSPLVASDKISNASLIVAAPPTCKKQKLSMFQSTSPKHAKLTATSETVVKKLMFEQRQSNVNDTKPSIIEVEKYDMKSNQSLKYWLPQLKLTESDKVLLLNPLGWVNDNIINAAQQLLKENCIDISGFQDVICGVALSFKVEPDEFIQILNNCKGHWLTICNIGCSHSTVSVYDSMYRSAGRHVNSQVATLLHSDEPKIYLNIMDTQLQSGGSDCGLFAIANATALSFKEDPGKMFYDQKQMRQHLYQCLENGKMTLFPVKRVRRALTKIVTVEAFEIHCVCRLPEGTFPRESWVKCTNCFRWYHTNNCLKVSKTELKGKWLCPSCSMN